LHTALRSDNNGRAYCAVCGLILAEFTSMAGIVPTDHPAEFELMWLRGELRATVKRWRFNSEQHNHAKRSRKELVEMLCSELEQLLEGGP
jgi:hypothetical protein